MRQPYMARALRVAEALLAAATLLAAALLIVQCADIYRIGTAAENLTATGVRIHDVYSRETVAQRLGGIAWSFIVWAVMLALTLVLRACCGNGKKKRVFVPLENRLELALLRTVPTDAMRAEERKRRIAVVACAILCIGCAVAAGAYFLQTDRFVSRDLESVMGAMLRWVAPWVTVAFAALGLLAWANGRSLARELEATKVAPRREPEPPKATKPALHIVGRVALAVFAAALIVAGILNGGMYDVLVKAINICTECIGLG